MSCRSGLVNGEVLIQLCSHVSRYVPLHGKGYGDGDIPRRLTCLHLNPPQPCELGTRTGLLDVHVFKKCLWGLTCKMDFREGARLFITRVQLFTSLWHLNPLSSPRLHKALLYSGKRGAAAFTCKLPDHSPCEMVGVIGVGWRSICGLVSC